MAFHGFCPLLSIKDESYSFVPTVVLGGFHAALLFFLKISLENLVNFVHPHFIFSPYTVFR